MIYGYTLKDTLANKHREAQLLRKKNDLIMPLLYKYQDDLAISNIRNDGITSIESFYDSNTIDAVRKAALFSIEKRKISRVRNRSIESKMDVQNGNFKFFSTEELSYPGFAIEEKANVVSVASPFENIPLLYHLVFNEKIIAYATNYFDAIPMVSFAKVTMSFCNTLPDSDTQYWHVDFGAKNIFKVIVYLNDVDTFGGPFSYIKGSHNKRFRGWHQQSRFETEELQKKYKDHCFFSAVANAGDCVLAETSGFHKGEKPSKKSRLCLIFNFTLHPEIGFAWNKINFPRQVYEKLSPIQKLVFSHDIFNVQ